MDLSPTEQRLLTVLEDGLYHSVEELKACLDDDMAERQGVLVFITWLRQKLQDHRDMDIVCHRRSHRYRLMVPIRKSN